MSEEHTAPDPGVVPGDTSRRGFLKAIGLSAAAVAAGSAGAITVFNVVDRGNGAPRAYAFAHADDIALWIGAGERFTIRVLRGRQVLEEHAGVQANGITDLESPYFTARHIAAPSPS